MLKQSIFESEFGELLHKTGTNRICYVMQAFSASFLCAKKNMPIGKLLLMLLKLWLPSVAVLNVDWYVGQVLGVRQLVTQIK